MRLVGTRPIQTDRLALRRWSVDDAQQMYDNWASDPEVTRFVTWPPHPNIDATRSLLTGWVHDYDRPSTFNWAVWLGDVIIGQTAVVNLETEVDLAEVGYCFGSRWWNHGYATETLKAVMAYLFDAADVNKVEARHDPANIASGKVMEKAGMVPEGLRRACIVGSTGPRDAQYHGLLRSQWRDRR
ncbi:GNAT family N-acetyltransferase [Cutibacterium sp. WCA-380-WT-3A]|uniref:GNAT family N-acetyltransferase n=1 Tax=Cutibacterium porci TaxID=2605781 RepID=A0A7K0J6C9_9ACTN|nr:GNAT family N-acetyltransferase [Cutibacterium porci]MSS45489.1 GNAT family N-acetyltransferase [Cutibacterium porci]